MARFKQANFDHWFEKHFRRVLGHPLYGNFKILSHVGADLDYVQFLCAILGVGDGMIVEKEKRRKKSQAEAKAVRRLVPAYLEAYNYYHDFSCRVLCFLTVQKISERLIDLDVIDPTARLFDLLEEGDRKQLILDAERAVDEVLAQYQNAKKDDLQTIQRRAIEEIFPFYPVWEEYSQNRRGRGKDYWGSFFMLAVTQHLADRNQRPHYQQAWNLLQKIRAKKADTPSRHGAVKAMDRIRRLKKQHPNWKEHLTLLRKQHSVLKLADYLFKTFDENEASRQFLTYVTEVLRCN